MICKHCDNKPMTDVIEKTVLTGSVCLSCGAKVSYLRGHEYAPTSAIEIPRSPLQELAAETLRSQCPHSPETRALIGAKVRASHARRGHKCMEASNA